MKNTLRFAAVAALAVSAVAAQAAPLDVTEGHYPVQVQSQSNLTRAEVVAQVKDAMAHHAMLVQGDELLTPASDKASSLSRAQVLKETAAAEAAGELSYGE